MKTQAAKAYFEAENFAKAGELSFEVNKQKPTVDTLLLEAKVKNKQKDIASAIELLRKAEDILKGKELLWT